MFDTEDFPEVRHARTKAMLKPDASYLHDKRPANDFNEMTTKEEGESPSGDGDKTTPPEEDEEAKRLERLRKAKQKQQEFDRMKRKRSVEAEKPTTPVAAAATSSKAVQQQQPSNKENEVSNKALDGTFLGEDNDDFWTHMTQMQQQPQEGTSPRKAKKTRSDSKGS